MRVIDQSPLAGFLLPVARGLFDRAAVPVLQRPPVRHGLRLVLLVPVLVRGLGKLCRHGMIEPDPLLPTVCRHVDQPIKLGLAI